MQFQGQTDKASWDYPLFLPSQGHGNSITTHNSSATCLRKRQQLSAPWRTSHYRVMLRRYYHVYPWRIRVSSFVSMTLAAAAWDICKEETCISTNEVLMWFYPIVFCNCDIGENVAATSRLLSLFDFEPYLFIFLSARRHAWCMECFMIIKYPYD